MNKLPVFIILSLLLHTVVLIGVQSPNSIIAGSALGAVNTVSIKFNSAQNPKKEVAGQQPAPTEHKTTSIAQPPEQQTQPQTASTKNVATVPAATPPITQLTTSSKKESAQSKAKLKTNAAHNTKPATTKAAPANNVATHKQTAASATAPQQQTQQQTQQQAHQAPEQPTPKRPVAEPKKHEPAKHELAALKPAAPALPASALATSPAANNIEEDAIIGQANAPRFKQQVAPQYPKYEYARGIEGTVILRAYITKNGRITTIEVIQAAHPALTRAALAAIQKSTYIPAQVNGSAINRWTRIPVTFKR